MEFKIIIESLLTASQFEVTVSASDRILVLKKSIEKILGIPVSHQNLLHQQAELDDQTVLKDVPIYDGIRLKLIPSMRVGPIQSARRVLPSLSDYDSWFDINEAMHNSKRDEPLMLKTKYLVYKGCKKNIHRWKLNGDKGKSASSTSGTSRNTKTSNSLFGSSFHGRDDEKIKRIADQEKIQENIRTSERMNELRIKMELASSRKKLKSVDFSSKKKIEENTMKKLNENDSQEHSKEPSDGKIIQRHQTEEKFLSDESKMKIKANLSRNRSFRTILSPSNVEASPSLSLASNETPRGSKVKESFSMQDFRAYGLLLKESVTSIESTSNATPKSQDYSSANVDFNCNATKSRLGRKTTLTKANRVEINEYFILPKLLVRKDSSLVSEASPHGFEDFVSKSETAGAKNQPSTESLIEYCDHTSSSSTSSLVSYQPDNRFYHSDLDLNQLTARFKTKLSLSNQDIKASEGNNSHHEVFMSDANFDKWANVDYATDAMQLDDCDVREASNVDKGFMNSELGDYFSSSSNITQTKKSSTQRIPPLKKKTQKLKCFGSNPILTATVSNLAATTTTSTNFLDVQIPQISLLESIPTKYRRGYINLSDACLSNTDLSLSQKLPRPMSERKHIIAEKKSFDHGSAIFHCQPQHRNLDISDINPADLCRNDVMGKGSSGRQSRFEHCDNYCSNLDQYASTSHIGDVAEATAFAPAERTSSFDFQSEENLFNMNFDSFYEDFSTAELSWSSTTSSASSSTASCESNSVSSLYEKNFKIFPKIELDQEFVESKTLATTPKDDVLEEKKEDPVQLRCFQCNKKLGIIMVMKCHCQKYFCTAHRYKEAHQCSYDFKREGKKQLELENPLCVTQKLPKI